MPFPGSVKKEAREKAHHCCVICQRPTISLQVHHIIPQEEDGPDTLDNACPLCGRCHDEYGGNEKKRTRLREIRDWWWEHCAKHKTNPDLLDVNRRIADLQITQERSAETLEILKSLLVDRFRVMESNVLGAKTLEELSAVSGVTGVSLPQGAGTMNVFECPPIEDARQALFLGLARDMPSLLVEMKADLSKDPLVREFVPLNSRGEHFQSLEKKRFLYYGNEHDELQLKIDLLEDHGFVEIVKQGRYSRIYRMTSEFVEFLKAWDGPGYESRVSIGE